MDLGAAEATLEGIRYATAQIDKANAARRNRDSLPIESDPNNRDN